MDSDDQIMPSYLSDMFSAAKEYDADVVHNTRCFSVMPEKGKLLPPDMLGFTEGQLISYSPDKKELTELTLLADDLDSRLDDWANHSYHFSVWNSMYKRSFLRENNIVFDKMTLAEDAVFYFHCMFSAKNFVVRPGGGYVYRLGDSSLSHSKKSPEKAVKAMQAQLEVIEAMKRITAKIPFFRDSETKTRRAADMILLSLEDGFIRPAFQSLGEDGMRSGEALSSFFAENFGENAPYV